MLSLILYLLDFVNASLKTRAFVICYGLDILLGKRVMNLLKDKTY